MPNEPESPKTPELNESNTSETPEQKKINSIANKFAAKARKRENLFDRNHGTFPRGGPSGMA
jgi:hypothetical protein